MLLITRPPQPEELSLCAQITQDSFLFDAAQRAELVAIWRALLMTGSALAGVVEDRHRPTGEHLVGFALGVFVSDAFVTEARTLPPYVSRQVLQRWRQPRFPVLSAQDIRRANSGAGLNYLGLHLCSGKNRVTPEQESSVRDKLLESWFDVVGGYHLKCVLREVFGHAERDRYQKLGVQVWNDYAGLDGADGTSLEERPFLLGITRDEALHAGGEGTYMRALFSYAAPRFGFSAAEQRLLLYALNGETDVEIARLLSRAPGTIKKQWLSIYAKAAKSESEFAARPASADTGVAGRGLERRRTLLNYLRQHPEELRPWPAPIEVAPARQKSPF